MAKKLSKSDMQMTREEEEAYREAESKKVKPSSLHFTEGSLVNYGGKTWRVEEIIGQQMRISSESEEVTIRPFALQWNK